MSLAVRPTTVTRESYGPQGTRCLTSTTSARGLSIISRAWAIVWSRKGRTDGCFGEATNLVPCGDSTFELTQPHCVCGLPQNQVELLG